MPNDLISTLKRPLRDVCAFSEAAAHLRLRSYQAEAGLAVAASALTQMGLSFCIMFPRQSGKNELQAAIESYILLLFSNFPAEIVKVSPTWKPQCINAMRRLERVLSSNVFTNTIGWTKESGYIYRVGQARIYFLSGQAEANIVGATANVLLGVDEAQDVSLTKYDKDIAPMAASLNATRVFWGTAWTSNTLLARELRACQAAQERDGIRRVFRIGADQVSAEVPAYKAFVAEQVSKFGRNHPMVKTQYFSEEIDAEGALFTPDRVAMMRGNHPAVSVREGAVGSLGPLSGSLGPLSGSLGDNQIIAFLVDVAGQDEAVIEGVASMNPGVMRDSTAVTVVLVDTDTIMDPGISAPTYKTLERFNWTGLSQADQYSRLRSLIDIWNPRHVIIDATGIGAGLSSFLERSYPNRVVPFVFTSASKSKLAWNFLSIIDAGRWKEPYWNGELPEGPYQSSALSDLFFKQLAGITYEILPGPGKLIRWGVPDGTRDPATGDYLHDDLVMSAALVTVLDDLPWSNPGQLAVIPMADPLDDMDKGF